MNASEAFKAGKLGPAIDAQLAEVRSHPADANRRLFLFELALFAGDLDRADKQGQLVKFGDAEVDAAMAGYLRLVEAERHRRRVVRDGLMPLSFGPLPDSLTPRIEALKRLREGNAKEAAATLAANPPPAVKGTCNGKPFEGFVDCDDLLAPVLEVMTSQGYFWVPLEKVRSLTTTAPKTPRDLYWLPAVLELDDSAGPVFLPALYPFSHEHADDAVKLGRMTDWQGAEGEPVRGLGQKTYLAGDDPVGILDIRELEVTT
jgi:type VI secretion system protein ImpE